jgi:hypothetical protein
LLWLQVICLNRVSISENLRTSQIWNGEFIYDEQTKDES